MARRRRTQAFPRRARQAPAPRPRPDPDPDGRGSRPFAELSQSHRARPAAPDRAGAAAAGAHLRHRRAHLCRRGRKRPGPRSLAEALADPMFRDLAVARHEIEEVARNAPGRRRRLVRLYRAHLASAAGSGGRPPRRPRRRSGRAPSSRRSRNHFPELDEAGEALAAELADDPPALRHPRRRASAPEPWRAGADRARRVILPAICGATIIIAAA